MNGVFRCRVLIGNFTTLKTAGQDETEVDGATLNTAPFETGDNDGKILVKTRLQD